VCKVLQVQGCGRAAWIAYLLALSGLVLEDAVDVGGPLGRLHSTRLSGGRPPSRPRPCRHLSRLERLTSDMVFAQVNFTYTAFAQGTTNVAHPRSPRTRAHQLADRARWTRRSDSPADLGARKLLGAAWDPGGSWSLLSPRGGDLVRDFEVLWTRWTISQNRASTLGS